MNALNALERQTATAMGGVERSVKTSLARQETLFTYYGRRGGEQFSKEFAKSFGVGREGLAGLAGLVLGTFIKDSVKIAAEAGSLSAEVFLKQWEGVSKGLQITVGSALSDIFLAMQRGLTQLGVPGGQLIEDQVTLAQTEKMRAAVEAGRTTTLQKNLQLTEQVVAAENKSDRLDIAKAIPGVKATGPKLGPLQAPGADELAAFDKVMKNLIFEEQQLGRTAEEQQVYNELKKAGVNIESEYGQAIALTTRQLYEEEQKLRAVKELNDGLQESTKTFVQGLLDGQSAAESFTAALRKMADVLLDMALHSLFNPGGTPLLQGLFGDILGLGQWTGGQLPGSSGSTASVSNAPLGAAGRMGSGMNVQHNIAINVQGSVDQKTLGVMKGMLDRHAARQNAELQRSWGNRQARYAALRGP